MASLLTMSNASAIDFATDIEPILVENCVGCHGEQEQNGQLRLDRLASMLAGGDSGERAVVPNDPGRSFLLKLIKHEEPGLPMPPDGKLTDEEIDRIEAWIAAGGETPASYGPSEVPIELTHWSFKPIVRPTNESSIDGFIRRELLPRGLTPSPRADSRSLIRRLYLVMHGLPPTPEEVERFAKSADDESWHAVVEQVLASPRYGERWASHWLDLIRFAESHGFEMNRERPNAWQFRDWVIDSFNTDMPYDRFVIAHLAGDAIEVPIGTGFLVAGPVDQVKGADPKLGQMQRLNELDDMINTCGTAFLGLTTGCARCHNHKFDPISQQDYYALQAIFAGVQHGDAALPLTAASRERLAAIERETDEIEHGLMKILRLQNDAPVANPGQNVAEVPKAFAWRTPVNARRNVERFGETEARFLRFVIESTNGGEPCIDEWEIYSGNVNVALAERGAKASSSGDFEHSLHKLVHINDGQYGNARSWISSTSSGGWAQIELPEVTKIHQMAWARDREGVFGDRLATQYRIEASIDGADWRTLVSSSNRLPFGKDQSIDASALDTLPDEVVQQARPVLKRLGQLRAEVASLESQGSVWVGQFRQPGPTHRLYRGEPDAKREQVLPDAIKVFTSLNLDSNSPEQSRRLSLANWIASKDNPLTARVIVNRIWQFHFGVGIVDTPSDFGHNGIPPTHPELLDWLAAELMANDWSLKHIHRLILQSDTWRQASLPRAEGMKEDAGSRFLWRFPSRRLEAEAIRDSILMASGALDLSRVGGPGFSAFEVEMENVRHYHAKKQYGPADWRRMIYMTKVRQEREHVFGAFDCPDASTTVPKRSRSTTPLQALNLLNSDFVMQQAELLAARIDGGGGSSRSRIEFAWRLCFQRPPTDEERAESERFIEQQGSVQFARALLNANEFVFIP